MIEELIAALPIIIKIGKKYNTYFKITFVEFIFFNVSYFYPNILTTLPINLKK